MNNDRNHPTQPPGGYPQSSSIADALLLEQLIRKKQIQDNETLRARIWESLGTTTTSASLGTVAAQPPSLPWNLPALPASDAAFASATLQSANCPNNDTNSLIVAQLLRNQELSRSKAALSRDLEAEMMLLRQQQQALSPTAALFAAVQADRVLPPSEKASSSHPATDGVTRKGDKITTAPPPPLKKTQRRSSKDTERMPPPKRTKSASASCFPLPRSMPISQRPSIDSSFTFPLPNKHGPPREEMPKLISFQRTWGKLEKCTMRTELFRRRLERGIVPLTGISRSVLLHARQQEEQQEREGARLE